jgi:hypothetical protein
MYTIPQNEMCARKSDCVIYPNSQNEMSARILQYITEVNGCQKVKQYLMYDKGVVRNQTVSPITQNEYGCLKIRLRIPYKGAN